MKNTERLVGIALAVLALEGCRGPQQHAEQPGPQPSQSPMTSSRSGHVGGGAVYYGAGAGGAGVASARRYGHNPAAGTDRVLGRGSAADGEGGHGGFGGSGAHGAGG